jgi:3-phenylpropionate/trans-cinnamate dioxygenase ferredoxin component
MSNWIEACGADDVDEEDVIPVEIDGKSYAIYRSPDNKYYATDGFCTHEQFLLADGLVMGHIIECPKHNGRFDYTTGEGRGVPICVNLNTYPVQVENRTVFVDVDFDRHIDGSVE